MTMENYLNRNNYFNNKEYFKSVEFLKYLRYWSIEFDLPNGYSAIVKRHQNSNYWQIGVAVAGKYVFTTPITDGFLICKNDKEVEDAISDIKNIRKVA